MSRIRVLNLPLNLKEQQVRSFFQQGSVPPGSPDMTITDIYIKRDRTDPSRTTMLFVGFKTSKAGEFAVKHFNGAFMGSQKLHVETAAGLNEAPKSHKERMEERKRERDERVEAAKKRQTEKENSYLNFDKDGNRTEPSNAKKQRKEAFVNARLDGGGGSASWVSEVLLPPTEGDAIGHSTDNDRTIGDAFPIMKKEHARAVKKRIEKAKIEKTIKVIEEASLMMPPEGNGAKMDNKNDISTNLSDLDFLNSLAGEEVNDQGKGCNEVTVVSSNIPCEDHNPAVESNSAPSSSAVISGYLGVEDSFQQEETPEDICRESRRVHIGNIPYIASEDDVKNYVSSQVGPIEHLHIPLTKDTKDSKGSAFITFVHSCDAVAALTSLNGAVFMGRLLRISAAKPDPHGHKDGICADGSGERGAIDLQDSSGRAFKAKKAEELRKIDQKGLNWNTTYMSSHAAVKSMADKLKVEVSDIVSVDTKGAAVRAAVAEAFLTSEAKMILGDEGICFEAIQQSSTTLHKTRSSTTILVKNLSPAQTKEEDYLEELVKLFKRFGSLENIAAPSSRVFALFAFLHPQDARVAYQRLSYRKFKGAPLFLEWAPLGSINDDVNGENTAVNNNNSKGGDSNTMTTLSKDKLSAYALFLSNLPIPGNGTTGVSEQILLEFIFEYCPKVARNKSNYIKAIRILDDKGQAFITCVDEYSQKYILGRLNDKPLLGRAISVKVSSSASKKGAVMKGTTVDDVEDAVEKGGVRSSHGNSTTVVPQGCDPHKIIVKNLPFEATEKDLRELFSAFSDVKSVRVPQKVHQFGAHRDNNHRGFGFVEFLTEQEAAMALKTLSATHLYGRHLVLQYAKKDV